MHLPTNTPQRELIHRTAVQRELAGEETISHFQCHNSLVSCLLSKEAIRGLHSVGATRLTPRR